jgi:hypothetical protein
MPTIKPNKDDLANAREQTDWRRLDRQSDADIARAIDDDPDAAPDMSAELRRGAFRAVEPRDVSAKPSAKTSPNNSDSD